MERTDSNDSNAAFEKHYSWQLGHNLVFHVCQGDLFKVPVQAIVNSEQTDFVLADAASLSVSGQIRYRYGDVVQRHLDELREGKTMPLGTVLRTDGGPADVEHGEYDAIFHAGFHHPDDLRGPDNEDDETEHLQVIRLCVRKVLSLVQEDPVIDSVAFPLIGSGIFGLSRHLVAHQFFQDVLQFAASAASPVTNDSDTPAMAVWLVVYQPEIFGLVVEAGVQAWLTHTKAIGSLSCWEPFQLGVPYLDFFEQNQILRERHAKYAAWMHVRYAELILGYMAAVMAVSVGVKMPEDVLPQSKPITFGNVRYLAKDLAKQQLEPSNTSSGGTHSNSTGGFGTFVAQAVQEAVTQGILHRINTDRNDLAHGKDARSASDIRKDIVELVKLPQWNSQTQQSPPPSHGDLSPWVASMPDNHDDTASTDPSAAASRCVGVLMRCRPGVRSYLIPWSGGHFEVPIAQ